VKLAIASDHGGLSLKGALVVALKKEGHSVEDLGTHSTESCDYPDFAHAVVLAERLRPDARTTIEFLRSQGVELRILSGDRPETVIAIARELNLPIRYVGIGEKVDDLLPFDPEKFIQSLFEK